MSDRYAVVELPALEMLSRVWQAIGTQGIIQHLVDGGVLCCRADDNSWSLTTKEYPLS
jgi:hypothetical protein